MIDTDRYEGHYTDDFARFWVTADDELNADIERANATMNLIDDAPHLLAEVKRLQRELYTPQPTVDEYDYIEWLEQFAPKAGEFNTAWDAYELAKGIHWTQMEEEE